MGNRLKTRVFVSMFVMAAACILITVGAVSVVMYKNTEREIVKSNKNDANYFVFFIKNYGEKSIEDIEISEDRRVTLIDEGGDVIYDSSMDESQMENHLQRPEVIEAMEEGVGEDKRVSDTMLKNYYYYAVRLEDGKILRMATTSQTLYASFGDVILIVTGLVVVMLIIAIIVSERQTRKIIEPINELDMDALKKHDVYDEMSPFVSRIRHQNKVIKKQTDDIRAKSLEFEAITQNMSEGLLIVGTEGEVLFYNTSALKLLNIDEKRENLKNIVMFNRSKEFENTIDDALEGVRGSCTLEIADKICQMMASPVLDKNIVKGAVLIIIDVTEREKRESLRREFSANVSHELKTPLTSISGYAEIMKSGMAKEEDMKKFSEIIYTEAKRLIDLVGDIIKVSKLDEDKVVRKNEEVELIGLIEGSIERLKGYADKRNIAIQFEHKDEEYKTYAVSQIVDEIIYNLIDNAIKYNKESGRIDINLSKENEEIRLSIKDTGIGIPKEDINRVFERFYRVDKSHSKEIGGTGLGLSIVKHSAIYIGAKVHLESKEGIGTDAIVTFKQMGELA